jgi:hypothetical protein
MADGGGRPLRRNSGHGRRWLLDRARGWSRKRQVWARVAGGRLAGGRKSRTVRRRVARRVLRRGVMTVVVWRVLRRACVDRMRRRPAGAVLRLAKRGRQPLVIKVLVRVTTLPATV